MNSFFVTGGNGFIGSHLVESLLADGQGVRALVRDPDRLRWLPRDGTELVVGNLEDPEALRRGIRGVDVVVHAAALTHAANEAEMVRANQDGTRRILEACLAQSTPPRLVFISSQAAGGPSPDGAPMTERSKPVPRSYYGRSKLEAERLLLSSAARLPVVVIRPPSVYGPRDSAFAFLFRMARRGFLPCPSGKRRVSIVHVADLVRAIRLAAGTGEGVYYVTDGEPHRLTAILQTIGRSVRDRVRLVPLPPALFLSAVWVWERMLRLRGGLPPMTVDRAREALAREWVCDDERARRELGFSPAWGLEGGMRMTAEWYRSAGWI